MKQANAIGIHGHLEQGRSCHSSLGSISSPTTSSGSGWFQKTPVITNSIFKNNTESKILRAWNQPLARKMAKAIGSNWRLYNFIKCFRQ